MTAKEEQEMENVQITEKRTWSSDAIIEMSYKHAFLFNTKLIDFITFNGPSLRGIYELAVLIKSLSNTELSVSEIMTNIANEAITVEYTVLGEQ